MLVYGDHARTQDPRRLIAHLGDVLAELPGAPAGIERRSAVISAFIKASELAQGLADAAFDALGPDDRSVGQDAAMAVLMSLARAAIASADLVLLRSHQGLDELSCASKALDVLGALELPPCVTTRRAEGYAYYALYPEAYAAAAAQIAPAPDMTVIGLRSIGTGLAAVVAAALDAPAPITLRPVGPPFQRELRLSPALRAELAAHEGRFALVDEGPGLSGSSFGCVADLLEDLGVAPERIAFFPGHDGAPGPQASVRHRRRWSKAERRVVAFDALISRDRLASWAEDLIGPPIAPIEDLSGGAWRALVAGGADTWPPANTLQERRKFKVATATGDWLMKFVGLGSVGDAACRRAVRLGEAGLSPQIAGLRHGFLVQRWIGSGRCGDAASGRHPPLSRLAAYLAFRAQHLPSDEGSGASLTALFEMARANTAEALGERRAGALDVWRLRLAALTRHVHPIETDNRMQAWEWVEATDGRWLKTDAVDHAHAHDLVGPQDIAWDVVGTVVELGLSRDEGMGLRVAVEKACGRSINAELVDVYWPAYLAFQLGAYAMAAEAHAHWPDEQGRLVAQRDHYAMTLDRLLARGRTGLGEGQP